MTDIHHPNHNSKKTKYDIEVLWMNHAQEMLKRSEYVDGELLAKAIRCNGNQPIPSDVLEYLCRFLEGKEALTKGRKPVPRYHVNQMLMIMGGIYDKNLRWLKARRKKYGHLEGWSSIRKSNFWQGPPNEIAARMVARKFSYGAESWRSVQNRISSRRKALHCCE